MHVIDGKSFTIIIIIPGATFPSEDVPIVI